MQERERREEEETRRNEQNEWSNRNIGLGESWNLNIENYLENEIQTSPLAQQAMPSSQVIQTALMPQGNITASGLTPMEQALLSPEEQQIRLRSRGLA